MSIALRAYQPKSYRLIVLPALYLAAMLYGLQGYVPWQSYNFLLGIVAFPYMLVHGQQRQTSMRLVYVAIVSGLLYVFFSLPFLLFFCLSAAMLSLWEYVRGKVSLVVFILVILMSPAFQYFVGVFSFPIRIELTRLAATLFNAIGVAAGSMGNVITCNGHEYTVDPACVGLKMIVTSFLCGLIMISVMQKQKQKYLSNQSIIFIMVLLFLVNIAANFSRILLLVYFNLLPGTAMHELVGLICLLVYVLFPALWVSGILVRRWGKTTPAAVSARHIPLKTFSVGQVVLLFIVSTGLFVAGKSATHSVTLVPVPGYKGSLYDKDVIRYANDHSLVYVKPISSPFLGEHNPLLCWIGEGYSFDALQQQVIGGTEVFSGVLKKGQDVLYTAWWYDNGEQRTISQLQWRWQMFRGGGKFSVVNVTTENERQLQKEITSIISSQFFNKVQGPAH